MLEKTLISPAVACGACTLPIAPEDFDWIVPQQQKRIFRILLPLVGDADTAETLTQECFMRAFAKRASFRGEAKLESWLARIAINLAYDYIRNRRLKFWRLIARGSAAGAPAGVDPRATPEQTLLAREQLETLWSAVRNLPLRQRTAFVLRYSEQMPLRQVAEIMNLEVGTVKSHLGRALAVARNTLGRQR